MATRQDIDSGVAIRMGGNIPQGHSLAPIRQALLDAPRERQWVIGQVVNAHTGTDHPADDEDRPAPCLSWVEMTAVTDTADCDQLAAMSARIRSGQPGQRTLDEGAAAG